MRRAARNTYYGSVWSIPIHSYGVEEIDKVHAVFDFLMTPTGQNDPIRAWEKQAIGWRKIEE